MTDNNRLMRYSERLLMLSLIAAAAISCSKDTDMDPVSITGGALSAESVELSPTGDEFLLSFSSAKTWSLKHTWPDMYPRWLDTDRQGGKAGTTVVRLSAGLNDLRVDRSAKISFVAVDGSFETEVSVVQPYPYLAAMYNDEPVVSDIDLRYDYDEYAGSGNAAEQIGISSNVMWGILEGENPGNFKVAPENGEGDGVIEILPAAPNFGRLPYTYEFDIVPLMENDAADGYDRIPEEATDYFHVSLYQDNFLFLLDGVVNDVSVSFSDMNDVYSLAYLSGGSDEPVTGRDGSVPVPIEVEAEKPWHVRECPEWVLANVQSGQNLIFELAADGVNPTGRSRSGTVVLMSDEDSRAARNIEVVQEGYLFEVSSEELGQDMSVSIPSDDLSGHMLMLDTRGPWEIRNIPGSWLEVTPESYQGTYTESGISSHQISFRALAKNLEFEDRVADIVFSRTVKPAGITDDPMDIDVHIVQNGFVFNVTPDPVLGEIPFLNTLPYQVEIDCSGPWRIESVPDWLNIPVTSGGAGVSTIWVNAKGANPYEDRDRSAVVEVVSVDHEDSGMDVRRSFEVLQRKYTFEFTPGPDIMNIPAYKTVFPGYAADLQCSAPWELISWPSWLSPDVTSGDGMEDISIMFTPQINASSSSRSGVISVKDSYKNREKSFEAVQNGFVFDGSTVAFNRIPVMNTDTYPVTFMLTAEAPWSLVSYPGWTNPSDLSGTAYAHGEATVNFTPEPNPELEQRSGTAVIRSTVNNAEKQVTFTQEPFEFDDSPESYDYTELDDKSESFYVECSGPWSVTAPSWVMFSPSGGSSSQTVRVSVAANTDLRDREAACRLTSSLNGLYRNIYVSQDAFEFDSGALSFVFETIDETEEQFDMVCSGSWTAENVPSWVKLSSSRGPGSEDGVAEEITLAVENNMGLADREAVIAFTSDDNPSLVRNVTVFQSGFVFNVSPLSCEFGPEADDARITVECSGDWTATCRDRWVDISSVRSGSFEISVDDNESSEARAATVVVTSTMNGLTEEIQVTQEGKSE